MSPITTIVKRKPPPKPAVPEHDFPTAIFYFGDPQCQRCHRKLSDVERTGRRCATDAEILAGKVFRRWTR